jgi:hypothetical protein
MGGVMGIRTNVYVGPYALWTNAYAPSEDDQDALLFRVLAGHWGPGDAVIEPDQEPVPAFFAAPRPNDPRRGGPKLALTYYSWDDECVALDLREVDREAEVKAFRLAYKAELDAIAQRVGHPPVLRWGIVYSSH